MANGLEPKSPPAAHCLGPRAAAATSPLARCGNERFVAAIEPWHGNEVAVYRATGASWHRQVIDNTLLDAHTIQTADLDGDGCDEIVAGFRGKPYGVYIYARDGAKWNRQILDQGGVSAASCSIVDLDGKGQHSIACIGSATHNLVLFTMPSE